MPYVELHFHLLPAVDDGPESIEDSVELARAAVADGSRTIVVTPHVHPAHITDPAVIPDRVSELRERLRRERIELDVRAGGELSCDMVTRLTGAELDLIAQGPVGRRWLLLEAPLEGLDARFTEAADELRARGFGIVMAHPERAAQMPASRGVLEHELAAGSVLQLTAWSFVGVFGDQARSLGMWLLETAPHTVIASDAHGRIRMPALRLAFDALRAAGQRDPGQFMERRPRSLLERGLANRPAALAA